MPPSIWSPTDRRKVKVSDTVSHRHSNFSEASKEKVTGLSEQFNDAAFTDSGNTKARHVMITKVMVFEIIVEIASSLHAYVCSDRKSTKRNFILTKDNVENVLQNISTKNKTLADIAAERCR